MAKHRCIFTHRPKMSDFEPGQIWTCPDCGMEYQKAYNTLHMNRKPIKGHPNAYRYPKWIWRCPPSGDDYLAGAPEALIKLLTDKEATDKNKCEN